MPQAGSPSSILDTCRPNCGTESAASSSTARHLICLDLRDCSWQRLQAVLISCHSGALQVLWTSRVLVLVQVLVQMLVQMRVRVQVQMKVQMQMQVQVKVRVQMQVQVHSGALDLEGSAHRINLSVGGLGSESDQHEVTDCKPRAASAEAATSLHTPVEHSCQHAFPEKLCSCKSQFMS